MIKFLKIESRWYPYVWILLVVVLYLLIFRFDAAFEETFAHLALFGVAVGALSGLSPTRTFKAFFYGFLVLAALLSIQFAYSIRDYFSVLAVIGGFQAFSGIFCGLFGMAGATLRGIILRQEMEVDLTFREWALLIGGVTFFADLFTFPALYEGFLVFLQVFAVSGAALCGLGLFVGIFSYLEYKELLKSVTIVSLVSHGIYLMFMILLFFWDEVGQKLLFVIPLCVLFYIIVLTGVRVGHQSKNKIKQLNPQEKNN